MQDRAEHAVLRRRHDHATPVVAAADTAECHRETALCRAAAPRIGLPDQAVEFSARHVAGAVEAGHVAVPADPRYHLPDIAHGPALKREAGHVHDGFVAELKRGQVALAAPHLSAKLAAAHYGRNPGMTRRLVQERVDRAWPCLGIADG